ncbi:MAG: ACT domain-containing protein [Gemmatimonadaceae bacterium]|jgi:hypothetical protein|nr:ACT domain-containing protein [Gemmatimonadaceae bacterium]
MRHALEVTQLTLAVARLGPADPVPAWALGGSFSSVTRTATELSVVCDAALVPPDVRAERDWAAVHVAGTLDFALVGVLAGITGALAGVGVSCFVLSTHDTDWILVRRTALDTALSAWRAHGYLVRER